MEKITKEWINLSGFDHHRKPSCVVLLGSIHLLNLHKSSMWYRAGLVLLSLFIHISLHGHAITYNLYYNLNWRLKSRQYSDDKSSSGYVHIFYPEQIHLYNNTILAATSKFLNLYAWCYLKYWIDFILHHSRGKCVRFYCLSKASNVFDPKKINQSGRGLLGILCTRVVCFL